MDKKFVIEYSTRLLNNNSIIYNWSDWRYLQEYNNMHDAITAISNAQNSKLTDFEYKYRLLEVTKKQIDIDISLI